MNLGRRRFLGTLAGTAATVLCSHSARAAIAPGGGLLSPLDPGHRLAPGASPYPGGPFRDAFPDDAAPALAGDIAPALLPRAIAALDSHGSRITNRDVVGLVDFSVASRNPRFHLVDIAGGRILSSHLVAHGRGSDPANSGWVEHLSNRPGSEASCSGSFVIGETYSGHHGLSRRVLGLDPENDQAEARGIVIHAAPYVDSGFIATYGRIGRSQGCFAVSQSEIHGVLERLGPGHLLYAAR